MKHIGLLFILLLLLVSSVTADDHDDALRLLDSLWRNTIESPRVALIPFTNYSQISSAYNELTPWITVSIWKKAGPLYNEKSLRKYLRRNRIRLNGKLSPAQAKKLKEDLGVDYVVLGSINYFYISNHIEIGLAYRIVDLESMKVLITNNLSRTSEDGMHLFDLNKIDSTYYLNFFVRKDIFDGVSLLKLDSLRNRPAKKYKAAIVGFDNNSDFLRAGDIVSSEIISVLYEKGFDVLEPGVVDELMAQNQVAYRGGVDLKIISELREKYDVDIIVTGTVDDFQYTTGQNFQNSSRADFSLSFIDASTGRLYNIYSKDKNGTDSEFLFQLNRKVALGQVSTDLLKEMIGKFCEEYNYKL